MLIHILQKHILLFQPLNTEGRVHSVNACMDVNGRSLKEILLQYYNSF